MQKRLSCEMLFIRTMTSFVQPPGSTFRTLANRLLKQRLDSGWWEGELSTSALSTATATMALLLASRDSAFSQQEHERYSELAEGGLKWLAEHQNEDGGWGDTVLSFSNISTTMLVNAVFHAADRLSEFEPVVSSSQAWIDNAGGVDAVIQRYGKDHTFSVPILTHCALAGIVEWKKVMALPFELSCIPARFYAAVRMPVVSYALPALIAIGQVIFCNKGHWNPVVWLIRKLSTKPSLRVLDSIQPTNGGFLEATPLTSFVCMSLLGSGNADLPVTRRCLSFIESSVRPDGSWPIDTNLTTWVTTLSVNAIVGDRRHQTYIPDPADEAASGTLSPESRMAIRDWLLGQQYRTVHPYTNSPPGGWSWTDLPGGVPDADDTPGAMLAVLNLRAPSGEYLPEEIQALESAAVWLLNLQNRDGGWPTFCRGWGTLPFDRSSNDLTAHVIRALALWQSQVSQIPDTLSVRAEVAIGRGLKFLEQNQGEDGSWLPLWFGNQHNKDDANPLYGTAKVVLALCETGNLDLPMANRAIQWMQKNQNEDGSWSGRQGLPGSVEETSLAVEALAGEESSQIAVISGVNWLAEQLEQGRIEEPAPIGFYFAKLWYFERLYPLIFATSALRRVSYFTANAPVKPEFDL